MTVRVGLIGFGTVGQAVARRLVRGDTHGLRLARVCVRTARERPPWLPPTVGWATRFEALLSPDIDVVVELVGGIEPARTWIRAALLAAKSVVSANKQLIAEDGVDLLSLAARCGRSLRFEGAVGGGVPIIRAVQDGLAGDRLVCVSGVLNGTCNYILTRMESDGLSFEDGLAEAQARGYAEADPAADIDGFDARAKLAILAAVALGVRVRPADIPCVSLRSVTRSALARARASGRTIRQVSGVERGDGARPTLRASVGPVLVPLDSPFARATECDNVIVVRGEYGGATVFSGRGAGGDPTAVAVISDLLAIAGERQGSTPRGVLRSVPVDMRSAGLAPWPIVHPSTTKGHAHVSD
jgi:homoserine dehydrogenase